MCMRMRIDMHMPHMAWTWAWAWACMVTRRSHAGRTPVVRRSHVSRVAVAGGSHVAATRRFHLRRVDLAPVLLRPDRMGVARGGEAPLVPEALDQGERGQPAEAGRCERFRPHGTHGRYTAVTRPLHGRYTAVTRRSHGGRSLTVCDFEGGPARLLRHQEAEVDVEAGREPVTVGNGR